MEGRFCSLAGAVGDAEECPRAWCAFWERGGAVLDAGCAVERLGLPLSDPSIARYLLNLRRELERARDAEAAEAALRKLSSLAPPDISGA
jgi:hypothetical protein